MKQISEILEYPSTLLGRPAAFRERFQELPGKQGSEARIIISRSNSFGVSLRSRLPMRLVHVVSVCSHTLCAYLRCLSAPHGALLPGRSSHNLPHQILASHVDMSSVPNVDLILARLERRLELIADRAREPHEGVLHQQRRPAVIGPEPVDLPRFRWWHAFRG